MRCRCVDTARRFFDTGTNLVFRFNGPPRFNGLPRFNGVRFTLLSLSLSGRRQVG